MATTDLDESVELVRVSSLELKMGCRESSRRGCPREARHHLRPRLLGRV